MKNKLLLFLLIVPVFLSLLKPGYFPMHDDIQGMRVLEMHKCVLDLQIPCRWVPDMGYGYGYPQFNFYSPLPYYLMEIPVLLGSSILETVKLGFIISLLAGAYSMYLLGAYLWGKKGGIVSALFYTYAPYRAVDIYVRGAMGEAWAFVFLPLIVLFTLKVLDGLPAGAGKKFVLPLALSVAGLLLTHNVTVIMFLPFYLVLFLLLRKPDIKKWKNVVIAGIWGVALSAFFVLPAFFEKEYTHIESITQGYFNYLAHFVGLRQMLLSTFWGYGDSSLGPLDGLSLSIGILHWILPLFVLLLLAYLRKFKEFRLTLVFTILGFVALFLMHPKSQFVWDNIELFSYIQFPWRFLSIAVFCFSVASGAVTKTFEQKNIIVIVSFVILLLMYGSYFKPAKYLNITDEEKFSGDSWTKQQTISIFDYLPVAAKLPPTSPAPDKPEILDAEGTITNGQKGTNWQKWEVMLKEDGRIRLSQFDFPVWEARVNGMVTAVDSENELGLITVDVPKGTSIVEIKLKDTNLRLAANLVSLLALAGVAYAYKRFR